MGLGLVGRSGWVVSLVLVGSLAMGLSACGDEEGTGPVIDTSKYTLSTAFTDSIAVTLDGQVGELAIDLSASSVSTHTTSESDLAAMLEEGTLAATVTNDDSGVAYNLVEGKKVTGVPLHAGEWSVTPTALADGRWVKANLRWFNEFKGSTVRADGDYSFTVTVLENPYFTTEAFTRQVTVTAAE